MPFTLLLLLVIVTHASAASPAPYRIMEADAFFRLTARQINDELLRLASAYPDLIRHEVIGHAASGNDILCLRLSLPLPAIAPATTAAAAALPAIAPATTGPGTGIEPFDFESAWSRRSRPAILVEAGTHARETANPYITYRMLASYAADARDEETLPMLPMNRLLTNCSIDFVILSNPDGYDLARHGKSAFTLPAIVSFLDGIRSSRYPYFKASATGVDLNRNYPAVHYDVASKRWVDLWGRRQNGGAPLAALTSRTPAPMYYAGPKPLSEPETRAMAELVVRNDYRVVLSYHSMGNVIYYDRPYLSPAYNAMARRYGERAQAVSGYRLLPTSARDNHSGYFGDYVANETGKPCLTVETTTTGFPTTAKASMDAFRLTFSLPYRMAELALQDGHARYRLFNASGAYVRDFADKAYAQAVAQRDGLLLWDARAVKPHPPG